MNCTNCNTPLEPNAKFCGECGHPVSPTSNRHTPELQCANCGAGIQPGFQFCGECGHPVPSEPTPSAPIDPEATVLEEVPPSPPGRPPAAAPQEQKTPPPPRGQPVEQPPPSPAPTVMAQDATPTPQEPAPPSPGTPDQRPTAQPPQEPPKKRRSGCTIILILMAVVVLCCGGSLAAGAYFIDNADFSYSSTGFDLPFLDQLQDGQVPFLDQFLGDVTPEAVFDDFFSSQINLSLENNFDVPACFVYISPSVSDEWGDDWLGEEEVIPPGATKTFQLEPDQFVDIYTLDCNGDLLYEAYEIDLSGEEVLIILEPGQ